MTLTLSYLGAVNLGCGLARTSASSCTPGLAWLAQHSSSFPEEACARLTLAAFLFAFVAF